jgi:hypothetical protein
MTIPFDSLDRWWIELAGVNPTYVDDVRPSLLSFLAFAPGREARFAGSGFVIAATAEFGLAITAKHVLTEGVAPTQAPNIGYVRSSPFVPSRANLPSTDPKKLKVCWMGSTHASLLDVLHIGYNDILDIACCIVAPQPIDTDAFTPVAIPLDVTVPCVGDIVHQVSNDSMKTEELVPPIDRSGDGQSLKLYRRVSLRRGVVTGVFPDGLRQYRWPCFTTSIPAQPGMSGGFATLPRDGQTIGACGVICADASTEVARSDLLEKGESIVAMTWPALCLNAPLSIPSNLGTPMQTLYAMMKTGLLDEALGGIAGIAVADTGNGNYTISRRLA